MGSTYVCRDWEPRNEYTCPIVMKPSYRNSGIIKAVTKDGEKIQVGKITYESFENEEFQYIITPFWKIIDTLKPDIFQGIPGIDMDLRLEHYYRVNYTPVFMTERTPGENREDLWELLDSVGLDYYDRLEWLIRTELRAAVDNLIVERAREEKKITKVLGQEELKEVLKDGQYGDEIIVESFRTLGRSSKECIKTLNRLMHYGVRLKAEQEQIDLSVEEYKSFLPLVTAMYQMDRKNQKEWQAEGIEKARKKSVYQGRKRKAVEKDILEEAIENFVEKKTTLEEVLQLTGLSRSTFYRRIKEYKKNTGIL